MTRIPRTLCAALIFLPLHAFGATGPDEVGEAHRIEVEDLKKELRYELDALKKEVEEVKAAQAEITAGYAALAEKAGEPAAPKAPARPGSPDADAVYAVPVEGSPVLGPADAPVTIVEISDFQCPYCQRVQSTLVRIKKDYEGEVRFVFKHLPLPFHDRARPAAHAAECAGEQGKFWPMHEKLFENPRELAESDLLRKARELQLNVNGFKKCLEENRYEKRIARDEKTAAGFGARGTPSFFINGRYLAGAQPYENFSAIVDEELAKAKKSGVARSQYYDKAVIAEGRKGL